MSYYFNSNNLIKLILKWKWHFIGIVVGAAIFGVVFSAPYFIKPKFKSSAVIYPSNLIPYSSETPTEQMLQLFQSEDIIDSLTKKFNLGEHYQIASDDPFYRTHLREEFEGNVSIRKTEYESVIIEVSDTDPQVACDMVEHMIFLMNLKARTLQREKTEEVVLIFEEQLIVKEKQLDSIQGRMDTLRQKYNLLDYEVQVKEYTRGYVKMIAAGKHAGNNELTRFLDNIKQYGSEYIFLNELYTGILTSYGDVKIQYDKSLSDLTKELTYTNMITNPVPADKKSYPVRWLIVLVSMAGAFMASLIVIALVDRVRNRKKLVPAETGTPS